jgi:hypothetical protein
MKNLTDETKRYMMVNSRNGLQQETIDDIFTFYQEYYGIDYLNALSNEYKKLPELVLITPQSINIQSTANIVVPTTDDIRNVFLNNLKCSACVPSQNIEFYQNPANIFNNLNPVDNLLNYIYHHIYTYFQHNLHYNITSPHTELWFLPDKNLYESNTACRGQDETGKKEKYICKPLDIESGMDEDSENKTSRPNIEPLTRGLAIKICNHAAFEKYNVLIVHNTSLVYLGTNINEDNLFGNFVSINGTKRTKRI